MHTEDDGYLAECPHFGCGGLLIIAPDEYDWWFQCANGCTHEQIVDYLQCDTRLDKRPGDRAWLCLRLALTPDTWGGLMLGRSVAMQSVDRDELERQRKVGLWQ
jgi:hypothetical protein